MPPLDLTAELLPQFVSPQLDDRVVRHPLNRAVGAIQSHRDFRRFREQTREFFLKFVHVPLHGYPRNPVQRDLQTTKSRAAYHKSTEFLY
jgi:hypothetical protein